MHLFAVTLNTAVINTSLQMGFTFPAVTPSSRTPLSNSDQQGCAMFSPPPRADVTRPTESFCAERLRAVTASVFLLAARSTRCVRKSEATVCMCVSRRERQKERVKARQREEERRREYSGV
jgi:hypothetical protein